MERESLLTVLIVLLSGMALQMFASWPPVVDGTNGAGARERGLWTRLWWPLVPALMVAAWLCGWALSEPDPVPDRVGPVVFAACVPFGLLVLRAALRAAWSLLRRPHEYGAVTVGLFRPQVVFAPEFVRELDDRALGAALEHERAHVRHRDPLRIWAAQVATDLQWPWPSARRRFQAWLEALEQARDDEARATGVDGADLAAAVLASLRFHGRGTSGACAQLPGNRAALEQRVARLLQPLPAPSPYDAPAVPRFTLLLIPALLLSSTLGVMYGERVIEPLLAIAS